MAVIPISEPRNRTPLDRGDERLESSAAVARPLDTRDKKKKDKVRSAWISFAGRIVAQLVGAIATVTLTLLVVQRMQHGPSAVVGGRQTSRVDSLPPATEPAVAVLPLDNFSGDPSQDYVADGMTEALVAELAQLHGIRVISRTSAMQYRGSQKPLPEIARELGVTHLIEGSVVRDKARVRVTAQLIEAASDRHVWAHTYDRLATDVMGMQTDVAQAIAAEVGSSVAGR